MNQISNKEYEKYQQYQTDTGGQTAYILIPLVFLNSIYQIYIKKRRNGQKTFRNRDTGQDGLYAAYTKTYASVKTNFDKQI